MYKDITLTALFMILFILILSGCTYQSVNHLSKRHWETDQSQNLEMDYFQFEYNSHPQAKKVEVKGTACLKKDSIPAWAAWIDDIWLAVYLSDDQGRVLAKDINIFAPRKLDYEQGIDFSFLLKPEQMGSPGPVFITFGYRVVLTPGRNYPGKSPDLLSEITRETEVFFASESALSRF